MENIFLATKCLSSPAEICLLQMIKSKKKKATWLPSQNYKSFMFAFYIFQKSILFILHAHHIFPKYKFLLSKLYIYIYIYLYIYIYIYTCMCVYVYVCLYIYIYIYRCVSVCVCISYFLSFSLYIYRYIFIYIRIYSRIYENT